MGIRLAQSQVFTSPATSTGDDASLPVEPRVHAEFEGGNLGSAEWVSPAHLRFSARADRSPRPLWFCFCLEGVRVPSVVCELVNADVCFGPRRSWSFARPVYSHDGRIWKRVERADYSASADGCGTFRFSVPAQGRCTWVAYCYPYTTSDLNSLLDDVSGSSGLVVQSCGETLEGRGLPLLHFGDAPLGTPAVWVLARQHAGETPASWVMEGLVRHLATARKQDAQGAIYLVPMVDPDGVFAGRYGKDETPVDFNRDWALQPARKETTIILNAIRASQSSHPVALLLDIHASHHGDTECYLFGEAQRRIPGRDLQNRFVQLLAQFGPPGIGLRNTDLRLAPAPPGSARGYLGQVLDCPALTLEVSYHLTQTGRYPGQQDYCDLGTAVARAIQDLLADRRS